MSVLGKRASGSTGSKFSRTQPIQHRFSCDRLSGRCYPIDPDEVPFVPGFPVIVYDTPVMCQDHCHHVGPDLLAHINTFLHWRKRNQPVSKALQSLGVTAQELKNIGQQVLQSEELKKAFIRPEKLPPWVIDSLYTLLRTSPYKLVTDFEPESFYYRWLLEQAFQSKYVSFPDYFRQMYLANRKNPVHPIPTYKWLQVAEKSESIAPRLAVNMLVTLLKLAYETDDKKFVDSLLESPWINQLRISPKDRGQIIGEESEWNQPSRVLNHLLYFPYVRRELVERVTNLSHFLPLLGPALLNGKTRDDSFDDTVLWELFRKSFFLDKKKSESLLKMYIPLILKARPTLAKQFARLLKNYRRTANYDQELYPFIMSILPEQFVHDNQLEEVLVPKIRAPRIW